ncbi:MAG: bifunctional ornithine acetyltransferase/N-acetylglutamate synthase [Campylobacteraceae bacterium 4484_4]|nr:MAG: bifunctional ornithine acetyltransferase/N-acetylglutamate synthase [Campylobacteraceae bacterium 4484_4]
MFKIFPIDRGLCSVEGFYCDGINVGMKPSDPDVAFIRSESLCDVSAVFTTNRFQAAPIRHFQRYPEDFQSDFVLINAKNANAMTGERGIEDIDAIFEKLSEKISTTNPIMSSTGVIGYRLDIEKITSAFDRFDFNAKKSDNAARAIMTTDTFEKQLAFEVELENKERFRIAAICKGAGMINPAMATMLCFIVTDADIPKSDMDTLLIEAVDRSFNRISVDGDTSTNDTVLLLSNKKSGVCHKEAFKAALERLTKNLALEILKDGEGATKVVAFEVTGAKSDEEAQTASKALSNSLLVKTALFGEDPNWGRIASTIGASGVTCDETRLRIWYDDLLIYSSQNPELDKETEKRAFEIMKKPQFRIRCDLGIAEGSFISYGCDLSYDYVKINADYRT